MNTCERKRKDKAGDRSRSYGGPLSTGRLRPALKNIQMGMPNSPGLHPWVTGFSSWLKLGRSVIRLAVNELGGHDGK